MRTLFFITISLFLFPANNYCQTDSYGNTVNDLCKTWYYSYTANNARIYDSVFYGSYPYITEGKLYSKLSLVYDTASKYHLYYYLGDSIIDSTTTKIELYTSDDSASPFSGNLWKLDELDLWAVLYHNKFYLTNNDTFTCYISYDTMHYQTDSKGRTHEYMINALSYSWGSTDFMGYCDDIGFICPKEPQCHTYIFSKSDSDHVFLNETFYNNATYSYTDIAGIRLFDGCWQIFDWSYNWRGLTLYNGDNYILFHIMHPEYGSYIFYRNSTPDYVNIECKTGIKENQIETFLLYPNPSNGPIRIKAIEPIYDVFLLDVNGQFLFHQNLRGKLDATLDVSSNKQGIYFLKVLSNQGILFRKIIIQ
jgi:hypothetical protein